MAAPEDVRIDVLIPAYNAASTIAEAVGSMQAQTLGDIRIVVVNDGSTDGTAEILADLARQDRRIEVISTPNGGIVDALNIGLAACRAPYIARHDADDIAFPERLETQLAYLQGHPECIAVGANVWHIDAQGRRPGTRSGFEGPVAPDAFWAPSREPYLMHPFLLVRRQALLDVGGYRYAFHSEDTDLYWRLLDRGQLFNLSEILGEYRLHAQSVSSASVVNGRIAAVNSQLAALSWRRRRSGREDIQFPKALLGAYQAAGSLEGIVETAARALTPEERRYLRIASAAKIMGLAKYRAYELEVEDCRFIKAAMHAERELLQRENWNDLRKSRTSNGIRLLRAARIPNVLALMEVEDIGQLAGRARTWALGRVGIRKPDLRLAK